MPHDRLFQIAYPDIGGLVNIRPIVFEVLAVFVTNSHRFRGVDNLNDDCKFSLGQECRFEPAGP